MKPVDVDPKPIEILTRLGTSGRPFFLLQLSDFVGILCWSVLQVIANHAMPSISFATGGEGVSSVLLHCLTVPQYSLIML